MKKLLTLIIVLVSIYAVAQVGIGTETPDLSAMLDVKSTEKGFLPPRMTTAQRDAINGGTFTEGLVIYNTDLNCLQFWNATEWISSCDGVGNPGDGEDPGGEDPGDEDPETEWTLTSVASYNGISVIDGQGVSYNGETIPAASTITLNVNVTLTGPYNIAYTHAGTGLTFSASGNFTATGAQTITLVNNEIDIPWDTIGMLSMSLETNAANTLEISPIIDVKTIPASETQVVEVTSATGRIWMDRDLGARRAATGVIDLLSIGNMNQWGRGNDGHEIIVFRVAVGSQLGKGFNSTTSTLSPSDVPGHNQFITTSSGTNDWRATRNDALWQGVSGVNNPCPSGFRLPTSDEIQNEIVQYSITSAATAFATPMKFSTTGVRNFSNTFATTAGAGFQNINYWTSTAITGGIPGGLNRVYSAQLDNSSDGAGIKQTPKGGGYAVRCIKN
ncbi:hypothetical protein [Moheibacter sediminis]|uniref:Fibrobacter succinogenes major paralogous domain-containing protein n=1 Tax=Moheibacter sediminis TaxID=1434700 RepID=A0A1W2AR29_9FLAO|nr:hypothetical protein [Moheibacter sediminis]SMC63176.1 hypothetical protein SAMN06296427_10522 [Moheibacter sediminis]